MLEQQQKRYLATILVLIVVLGITSLWHKVTLKTSDQAASKTQVSSEEYRKAQEYLAYLESVQTDPTASRQVFQTLVTQDEIRQQVEDALQVNQTIVPPKVDDKKIKLVANSNTAVNSYLSNSLSRIYQFNQDNAGLAKNLFSGDDANASEMQKKISELVASLYSIPVPKDALAMQKSIIASFLSYSDLAKAAKAYDPTDPGSDQNDPVWPQFYKDYAVANDGAHTYSQEINKVANKYQISVIPVYYAKGDGTKVYSFFSIPQAQAFPGVPDFSITIGDIPSYIMDGIKQGLTSSMLQFAGSMLQKLITKIEQNYKIANFLYYTDALVNSQYADDYLGKYVPDSLDKKMVKNFIPQFSCGKQPSADLQKTFQAKAMQRLGFDPSTISLSDPDYYQKMAKMGDYLSSSQGWKEYYQDMASQALSAANQAAQNELNSPGYKVARSTTQGQAIVNSISSHLAANNAAYNAMLQLGPENADSIVGKMVSTLTQNMVNNLLFKGASMSGGGIGVLKEQSTCVATAMISPITTMDKTDYQTPSSGNNNADYAKAQACSYNTSTDSDCTNAIVGQLQVCADNTNKNELDQLACDNFATSPYVKALQQECVKPPFGMLMTCTKFSNLMQKLTPTSGQ